MITEISDDCFLVMSLLFSIIRNVIHYAEDIGYIPRLAL
jgi:hypothetical protein